MCLSCKRTFSDRMEKEFIERVGMCMLCDHVHGECLIDIIRDYEGGEIYA